MSAPQPAPLKDLMAEAKAPTETNPSWERVQLARHPKRPHTLDYIQRLFTNFEELHGDRAYGDDHAIVAGPAWFDDRPVMIIGQQKGRDTKQKLFRNFGMPKPEGYRKSLRLMQLAAKFSRPVITFLDTMGAYPGIDAEERGQAEAIAQNLREMSRLPVPVICVVIGEGGSGGALALGVGNRIYMLENAVYSVISPESCAAILYRDSTRAPRNRCGPRCAVRLPSYAGRMPKGLSTIVTRSSDAWARSSHSHEETRRGWHHLRADRAGRDHLFQL